MTDINRLDFEPMRIAPETLDHLAHHADPQIRCFVALADVTALSTLVWLEKTDANPLVRIAAKHALSFRALREQLQELESEVARLSPDPDKGSDPVK